MSCRYNQREAILLVEDDPDALETLHDLVKSIIDDTVQIFLSEKGSEAIDIINMHSLNLIIADIHLPDISGLQILQKIRDDFMYIPVIFVTALQGRDIAIEALRLNAFDFIEKPISREKLEKPLRSALAVSRAFESFLENSDPLCTMEASRRQALLEILRLRAMRHQDQESY